MHWSVIIVGIIFFVNILCCISLIFIERRNPTTTWAWLLIFAILPIAGFFIYMILGQNLSRQKIFKEKIIFDASKRRELSKNVTKDKDNNRISERFLDLIKMNFNSCGSIYTKGNDIKLYVNGEDKFKDLIEDIKNAKNFIHMEYYIFRYDELGKAIIEELRKKVVEGIEVRLLVDGMGSNSFKKKEIEYIKKCGIKFAVFFPGILPHINTRINYRNHRKIVVIDAKIGYVGGFNVGNEYVNKGKQFKFWRDTHVKIVGNAVNELSKRFLLDWEYASEETLSNYIEYFYINHKHDEVGIQIVSSGPDHEEEYIRNTYLKMINDAKEKIYFVTPYLVLDEPMMTALKLAASSGIDVRLIVPGKSDHSFMAWILSANIGELLKSGVRVYKYNKGFVHAKTMVVDGEVSSIGTANFDIRSFKLNFEVNAIIFDYIVGKQMEEIYFKDLEDCIEITQEEYENRSRTLKIKESLIRLIGPIL